VRRRKIKKTFRYQSAYVMDIGYVHLWLLLWSHLE